VRPAILFFAAFFALHASCMYPAPMGHSRPRPATSSLGSAAVPAAAESTTGVRRVARASAHPAPSEPADAALAAVVRGLEGHPRTLPASYMFDSVGSRLFACLRSLDAAGRTERTVWRTHGREIARAIGERATLLDPHAGDGALVAILASRLKRPVEIVIADRLAGAAARAATAVRLVSPDAPVLALGAADPWAVRIPRGVSRTVVHLASALVAECEPVVLRDRLVALRGRSGDRGALLAGFALRTEDDAHQAVFADRAGIAASFDLNLLGRINRELGGTFRLSAWSHQSTWNAAEGRVEMRLVSKRAQTASVGPHEFSFAAREEIRTLVAQRYTLEGFAGVASAAGWHLARVFVDPGRTYALVLCER
jgi:L-histidine N-alpha-methyltransferase